MSFKAFITKTTAKAKSGVNKVSATVKLYSKKNALVDSINDMFDTLGKMTYYNATGEGSDNATEDMQNVIDEITRLKKELEDVENEICEVNARKKCTVCHTDLPKDVHYCPHCGTEVKTESEDEATDVPEENTNADTDVSASEE